MSVGCHLKTGLLIPGNWLLSYDLCLLNPWIWFTDLKHLKILWLLRWLFPSLPRRARRQ